eukprot:295841_1
MSHSYRSIWSAYVIAMIDSAPLRYMSFWEYNPAEFANWTNYAFTKNLTLIEEGNLLGINHLYEVSDILFDHSPVPCINESTTGEPVYPIVLKSNYNEEWNKNLPLLSELYANNSIFGFFMGDELVWQGLNPNDLNIAIQTIRANFSDCIIYYNDAKMVFYPGFNFCQLAVNYSKISKYLDWISVSYFHHDGPNDSFVSEVQTFYEQHIYPTMNLSHQYAVFVPGSFASNCNAECDVSCYDQMCSM